MNSRSLIDRLYETAAPQWGCSQVEDVYEEWSVDQELTDEDVCAMYDEYVLRKEV